MRRPRYSRGGGKTSTTPYKDGKRLTPLRREFAKEYIKNGGNGTRAILAARAKVFPEKTYSDNMLVVSAQASHILSVPAVRSLIQAADKSLIREAEASVQKLAQLRDSGTTEDVQLKASSNLINAYMTVTKRLQDAEKPDPSTTNILVTNMTTEEIMKRIENLKNGVSNA